MTFLRFLLGLYWIYRWGWEELTFWQYWVFLLYEKRSRSTAEPWLAARTAVPSDRDLVQSAPHHGKPGAKGRGGLPVTRHAKQVLGEPGANPFLDDPLLGQHFVPSTAAPLAGSMETQPLTQGFVLLPPCVSLHPPIHPSLCPPGLESTCPRRTRWHCSTIVWNTLGGNRHGYLIMGYLLRVIVGWWLYLSKKVSRVRGPYWSHYGLSNTVLGIFLSIL